MNGHTYPYPTTDRPAAPPPFPTPPAPESCVMVLQRGQPVWIGNIPPRSGRPRPGIPLPDTGPSAMEGVVSAVMIEGDCVSYKVVWWNGRSREEKWVGDYEVSTRTAPELLRVGFTRPSARSES